MCFGVRDAIALVNQCVEKEPLTVLGELVHNEQILRSLRMRGVQFARELQQVRTSTVMITAHGTSDTVLNHVRESGFNVVQATCPLVHHAHKALEELVREGFFPVVIGQRDHVEVRGLTGDLHDFAVVLTEDDVAALQERPRFGVISQTTQPSDRVRRLVELIRRKFPNSPVVFRDTVCQPTKHRQSAAIELARQCDVVVVIGGAHSNNTRELVATCSRYCAHVHHVQSANDLRSEWFADADTIGITAGTSTPDSTINEMEEALGRLTNELVEHV
jgi:4-hydroxy-3-methylbut-2-en-1-yl diphosphate reductase